jgi:hypothetical protein
MSTLSPFIADVEAEAALLELEQVSPVTSLLDRIQSALRGGLWSLAVGLAIASGNRDANALTNMIFFARHPELKGRQIRRGERALADEWSGILNGIVQPALDALLRGAPAAPSPSVPAEGATAPGELPQGPFGTLTARYPGVTTFSYRFTPEDAVWTARLILGEAGGRDDAENRAVVWTMFNRYALFAHPDSHFGKQYVRQTGRRLYPTFAEFVRTYSTTLQPYLKSYDAVERAKRYAREKPDRYRWVPGDGTFRDAKGRTVEKGQLAEHLHLQRRPWSDPKLAGSRRLVEAALTGRVRNPIGLASNFADTLAYYRQHNTKPPDWPKGRPWPSDEQWREYTNAHARSKGWIWIGPRDDLAQYGKNSFFVDRRLADLHRQGAQVVEIAPPS